jgi:hypothetical protein
MFTSITWGTTVYDTKSLARDGLVIDDVDFYNVALVVQFLEAT